MTDSTFLLASMTLGYFIVAALGKLWNFKTTVASFIQVTTPFLKPLLSTPPPMSFYQTIITGVIVFQLVSLFSILYAIYNPNTFLINMAIYALYGLILFTITATALYHLKLEQSQLTKTLSNIAIIAALWMLKEKIHVEM